MRRYRRSYNGQCLWENYFLSPEKRLVILFCAYVGTLVFTPLNLNAAVNIFHYPFKSFCQSCGCFKSVKPWVAHTPIRRSSDPPARVHSPRCFHLPVAQGEFPSCSHSPVWPECRGLPGAAWPAALPQLGAAEVGAHTPKAEVAAPSCSREASTSKAQQEPACPLRQHRDKHPATGGALLPPNKSKHQLLMLHP